MDWNTNDPMAATYLGWMAAVEEEEDDEPPRLLVTPATCAAPSCRKDVDAGSAYLLHPRGRVHMRAPCLEEIFTRKAS